MAQGMWHPSQTIAGFQDLGIVWHGCFCVLWCEVGKGRAGPRGEASQFHPIPWKWGKWEQKISLKIKEWANSWGGSRCQIPDVFVWVEGFFWGKLWEKPLFSLLWDKDIWINSFIHHVWRGTFWELGLNPSKDLNLSLKTALGAAFPNQIQKNSWRAAEGLPKAIILYFWCLLLSLLGEQVHPGGIGGNIHFYSQRSSSKIYFSISA